MSKLHSGLATTSQVGARHAANRDSVIGSVTRPLSPRSSLPADSAAKDIPSLEAPAPIAAAADFLTIIVMSIASGIAYHLFAFGKIGPVVDFAEIGTAAAVIFWTINSLSESRRAHLSSRAASRLRDATMTWMLTFVVLLLFVFLLKASESLSRGAVILFYVMGWFALMMLRTSSSGILVRLAASHASRQAAIVVGSAGDPSIQALLVQLKRAGRLEPIAILFDPTTSAADWPSNRKKVISRVAGHARTMASGAIFLCSAGISAERLEDIRIGLSLIPRALLVIPDDATVRLFRDRRVRIVGEQIAVEAQREPLSLAERAIKRAFDVCGALFLLTLLVGVFAIVALAIKLDSRGPVFFRQTRNGYQGRPFGMLKFRSMYVSENHGVIEQARKNDARVTRVGRWLRKTSIDELPQLVNVLSGEMSLVGPRPHALSHDELYARIIENYEIRQHVKPGMTGWAQVQGLRGETATSDLMDKRILADLWYVMNCSLILDAKILLLTIFEVINQRNAY